MQTHNFLCAQLNLVNIVQLWKLWFYFKGKKVF